MLDYRILGQSRQPSMLDALMKGRKAAQDIRMAPLMEALQVAKLQKELATGGLSAEQRFYNQLTRGLTPEQQERANLIKLGLEGRAVTSADKIVDIGGVPHIFDEQANTVSPIKVKEEEVTTATVGDSKGKIAEDVAAGGERGRLNQRLKLEPEVAAAVREATMEVEKDGKIASENRSNKIAMNLYETAMSGLVSALGGTVTGPFMGWSPALTANQQIADGSVAAMAPILKQLFRAAGEGTFTDKDQELLLEMIPTRKDKPEARAAKLQNIDAIVRAKLNQPDKTPAGEFKSSTGISFTVE